MTPIPKPTPLAQVRQDKRAAYREKRKACREKVIARDKFRCRICRKHCSDVGADVHELVPRSLGGDPTDPRHCLTVCRADHRDLTENRTGLILMDPVKGTGGKLWFIDRKGEGRYV